MEELDNNFAFFPGSFLPFHEGHLFIYNEATKIFKNVIIVKASNPIKNNFRHIYNNIPLKYIEWNDLISTLCKKMEIYNIVRGYRTPSDYLFEKQLCLTYRILNSKINFVLLPSNINLINTSSNKIRGKNEKMMKIL